MIAKPPVPETRFDRGAALVLAAVLAFAALVVVVTASMLARPADGWLMPGSGQFSTLAYFYGDWATPLQAGDQILAVNGLDVSNQGNSWLIPHQLQDWRAGATVTYTLRRGDQELAVPVRLYAPGLADQLRALAHAAQDSPGEWSFPLVALMVFGLRPGSPAARQLLLMMVSHAAAVKVGWAAVTIGVYFAPPGLFTLNLLTGNFWIWLFWPTVIWLVLSFPLPVWPVSRWPRLAPLLLYALGVLGLAGCILTEDVTLVTVALVGELLLLVLALGLALANAFRHWRNRVARAQATWIILGFAVSQGVVLALYLADYVHPFSAQLPAWAYFPFPLALPLCLGIAITRYRLFDIDVIIRRTLLYALLTGLLALVYSGSVVLLQAIFQALFGQAQSALVTVLSTLAIAALFVPLRRRLQTFIDRRFFRRKYDAARTLAAFAAAARDDVNLAELSARLVAVVDETMQPETVDLWLAQDKR